MKRLLIILALVSGFILSYSLMDTWVKVDNFQPTLYYKLPVFGPSLVNAQAPGTNIVYQQILTNASTGASANVRNIGQSMHTLTLQYANAPSHTCNNSAIEVAFENSSDGTHYTPMGPLLVVKGVTNPTLSPVHMVAYGAYPFIRVNYIGGDNTNCRLNGFYTGTIYPIGVNATSTYANSSFITQVSISTSGTRTTSVITRLLSNYRFILYGMTLQSNSTSAVFAVTEDNSATPGACNTTAFPIVTLTTTSAIPAIWQANTVPFYQAILPNSDLCVTATTAGSDTTNILVTYRYE